MAYMTQKGYYKLVAELQHMETVDRPAASAAIAFFCVSERKNKSSAARTQNKIVILQQ